MIFNDKAGGEWLFSLTVESIERALNRGVDYRVPHGLYERLATDDLFVGEFMWAFVADQAAERGLSKDAFRNRLVGKVVDDARIAIDRETHDFFSSATLSTYQAEVTRVNEVARSTTNFITALAEAIDQAAASPEAIEALAKQLLSQTSAKPIESGSPSIAPLA